jgi:hypothetical protein
MSRRVWSFDDLARFLRYEDPEVRAWAVDRLVRHYDDQATELIAQYLFDDHEMTPEVVAAHLARHGKPAHIPLLERAVKSLRGLPAARALEALVRLRAPGAIDQVRAASGRKDFDVECWAQVAEALAGSPEPPARRELRDLLQRRADWFGRPPLFRAALGIVGPDEGRAFLQDWVRSLQWRGLSDDDTAEAFRILMDDLEIDDCGWCFRTNLAGRIDFARTMKAIEAAYDCEVREAIGDATCERLAAALGGGAWDAITTTLAKAIRERARDVRKRGDTLPARIVEVAEFWGTAEARAAVEGLGQPLRDWVVGLLLSALVKMARYRNYALAVEKGEGSVEGLLPLLEIETSLLLDTLPAALGEAVARLKDDPAAEASARRTVEERCLAILAARGPFFPQAMALETLGELRSLSAIDEIIDFLAEENSYLYESAEHALSLLGEAVIEPARARLASGRTEADIAHSLLIVLAEIGTPEALRVVVDHLDDFVEAAGAADAARWMALFGARELIDPLRRHLSRDVPMVGQALLLLGAIHNVRVPEENAIRRAIDDYFKQPDGGEGSGTPPADGSDRYLM